MHLSKKKLRDLLVAALALAALAMIVLLIVDLTGKQKAEPEATVQPSAAVETATPTAETGAADEPEAAAELETEAAPVYLQDYYAGTQLDLTQYLGKVVLINYFTEWCPYCMDEMPDIKKALDTYDPESLVVILVHPWDNEDETHSASVVSRFGLESATVLEDKDFSLVSAIGVPGYPTSVIVDREGYVYDAVASMITLDWLAAAFAELGVPVRGDTVPATPAP